MAFECQDKGTNLDNCKKKIQVAALWKEYLLNAIFKMNS